MKKLSMNPSEKLDAGFIFAHNVFSDPTMAHVPIKGQVQDFLAFSRYIFF